MTRTASAKESALGNHNPEVQRQGQEGQKPPVEQKAKHSLDLHFQMLWMQSQISEMGHYT